MSIFENMDARQIAMCLSAFYEDAKEWKGPRVSLMSTQVRLPNRSQPINMFRSDFDEGIKILREDYDVFWTPDTKPDDLKWKINKRLMEELEGKIVAAREHYDKATRRYIDTDIACTRSTFGFGCVVMGNDDVYRRELGLPDTATFADICYRIQELKDERDKLREWKTRHQLIANSWYGAGTGVTFGPGCVVTGNDYLYRRELGLPDNATVADICKKIRRLMDESCVLNDKVLKLEDADRLRRHWHSKYEEEHKECVRLSKLHAADKEKKDKQDAVIHNLRDNNTTLEYAVAALKNQVRRMEAADQKKEMKNKVITDTLRDNLVNSVEECKRLQGRIRLLEDQLKLNGVPPLKDPLDSDS